MKKLFALGMIILTATMLGATDDVFTIKLHMVFPANTIRDSLRQSNLVDDTMVTPPHNVRLLISIAGALATGGSVLPLEF